MFQNWKWISFGIGVLVGAVGASLVSSRPTFIRDGASTVLSHGIHAKRKIQGLAAAGRENLEDLVAEADQKLQDRQAQANAAKE
ncbi:MAG: hypothetical protein LBI10_10465 [Deltaproteobacteria bacterium]|jgi:hypothetical protein|nr:hypothetical protein [Deltaproteobacteria bacterium]